MEILKYLPIVDKMTLIEVVMENCFTNEKFNNVDKEVYFNIMLVKSYTDYELNESENVYELYDKLMQDGILEKIEDSIPEKEISFLMDCINERIKERQELSYIMGNFLNKIVEKIPDEKYITKTLNSLPKLVNKIKPENLDLFKKLIGDQANMGVKKSGVK